MAWINITRQPEISPINFNFHGQAVLAQSQMILQVIAAREAESANMNDIAHSNRYFAQLGQESLWTEIELVKEADLWLAGFDLLSSGHHLETSCSIPSHKSVRVLVNYWSRGENVHVRA
jgi:hypothetical protein